ncbi:MAG: hypothetical protein OEW88_03210 [Gammaproteobacteria bacterium]|nr:hypothetical protein [Gammaproteobacteria bacterium]
MIRAGGVTSQAVLTEVPPGGAGARQQAKKQGLRRTAPEPLTGRTFQQARCGAR